MMNLIMSLHLHLLPFFLFFLESDGQDADVLKEYCPESKCGDVLVRYPFYRTDTTSSARSCGYKGFGVNCVGVLPTFELKGSYKVKNISYEDKILSLVDMYAITDPSCPRLRQNLTIEALPLEYSTQGSRLTFYLNCSSGFDHGSVIGCLSSGVNRSYVFEGVGPENVDWYSFCEEKVLTASNHSNIRDGWLSGQYGPIMNQGFELQWRTSTECRRCERSRGRCGFNEFQQSLCFCDDGTITNNDCRKGGLNLPLKLGIGFGAGIFGATAMCIVFFLYQRRLKNRKNLIYKGFRENSSLYPTSLPDMEKAGNYYGVHIFDYEELQRATNDFDSNNVLGDGGFGEVYKGKLQDGRDVAIKRLYEHNFKRVEQFMNEIEILTRLQQQNLVILYGCTNQSRELLLVYEYIPNGTVADHLHGDRARPGSLSWTTRLNIAIETASALSYLHAVDVIHRDVKTTNILLDNHFRVKVADFGLSRLFPMNVTHVSTAPQGTPGYVDPEYHQCYHLTDRSDVYSFGVVLIELISTKPAVDITRHRQEINLSNMAINKIQGNALHELVDPHLGFKTDNKVKAMISAVAELAFRCLQGREMRPSMEEVHETLLEIQSDEFSAAKQVEIDIPADDAILLKNDTLVSPDSGSPSSRSGPGVS